MTTLELVSYIIFGLLALASLIGAFLVRRKEKKRWNNGHCECGGNWSLFDYSSHGDRGYHCPKCDRYIWISYNVDNRKEETK